MDGGDRRDTPPNLALRLAGVGKTYGGRRVLHNLDLTAEGGEIVAVTGANGSGKSSLLKIVAGLLRPSRGEVTLHIGAETRTDGAARRASVGYAGPDLALYPELTGRENLEFFDRVAGRARGANDYDTLLTTVGLRGRGDDPVAAYSSGMRQRLRLAWASLPHAPLLLLDEPGLALDESGVALVGQMVAAQAARGGITLLATNDPREAALGGRAVALGA